VARAVAEVAAREGSPITLRESAVRLALHEAEHLVQDDVDVPGALHFTFSRHRDMFSREAAYVLARVLETTSNQLGIKIMATHEELIARLEQAPESVEDARDWFSSRVVMYGG
jgi:hypothetical protein